MIHEHVVSPVIDNIGKSTIFSVITIKAIVLANIVPVNDYLTAGLTVLSIVYMGLKIFNEWRIKKDLDKKKQQE